MQSFIKAKINDLKTWIFNGLFKFFLNLQMSKQKIKYIEHYNQH